MSDEQRILKELNELQRLCILNFVELQDMRRRLNIESANPGNLDEYRNELREYLSRLDNKMHALSRDFPHLDPE